MVFPSQIPLPALLRSTPVTALRRYYERSDSYVSGSSAQPRMNTVWPHIGLPSSRTHPSCPFRRHPPDVPTSSLSHATPQRDARTGSPVSDFVSPPQTRQGIRPYRVRHPTDWALPADCSPPRLAATQLPLGTGRRAFAWEGFPPSCVCALEGARWGRASRGMDRVRQRNTSHQISGTCISRASRDPCSRPKAGVHPRRVHLFSSPFPRFSVSNR